MKQELEEQLVKKYPKLYAQYGGDMTKTCMHWGFECGDGWFKIIDELSAKLEPYGFVEAAQVKEKFGGLRFYTDGVDSDSFDEIQKLIDEAEMQSYKTCERCGEPGEPKGGGWISTLCDNCRNSE